MRARRDFLNQALLDRRRSVYHVNKLIWQIFAVAAYGAAMCEKQKQNIHFVMLLLQLEIIMLCARLYIYYNATLL